MANLNKVILMGNLTRDPELRYTPNGTAVVTMNMAMNRTYGEDKKTEVTYVRVVAWAKLAQICDEYLFKGRPLMVEGRLQSRSWEASDGSKRSALDVVAINVQFLGKGKDAGDQQKPNDPASEIDEQFTHGGPQDEEVPF